MTTGTTSADRIDRSQVEAQLATLVTDKQRYDDATESLYAAKKSIPRRGLFDRTPYTPAEVSARDTGFKKVAGLQAIVDAALVGYKAASVPFDRDDTEECGY